MLELLKLGQQRAETQRALAQVLDLSESYVSRLLKGTEDSMGVGPCLRLARLLDMKASEVLEVAGKREDATLIAEFYGPERKIRPRDMAVLSQLVKLTPGDRSRVEQFIDSLKATATSGGHRGVRAGKSVKRAKIA